MVDHIYKHCIVSLMLDFWFFGYANKQVPFSGKAEGMSQKSLFPKGADPFIVVFPP